MSDDNPHSSNGSSRGWLDKFVQTFTGEPQNREQLVEIINDAEQREVINPGTREMIEGVLDVADMKVRDIMIPRAQIVTININDSVEDFLPTLLESAHSRFPIISEDKDHIEGILLAKDLLQYMFSSSSEVVLKDILRPAVIVPESKRVDVLLKEFRQKRYHMAIVVDEYGGVSGLVTIEDILEEIVGEIEDEHDEDESHAEDIRPLNKNTFLVKALTEVEDFNQFFNTEFDEEEADTIGGIVLNAFGHMPERNEEISINGFEFRVANADKRRLIQLKVSVPKESENDSPNE
ncbi:CNNM family magnesium/cobalt transport protein CorC [Neptunicella marina]|uniref:Magnesium and cobalt efflux protein CorC n=1 Tax=Neptunicella marina TaxID=2125989 RepID=A0A8J6M2H8_9ALTE|nr:CNNM family magnesium/cobalt transport protein CorC [Neptunicella marina]MBC3764376.1 CNNM family magnesium/cobalt transport protein CorC [Neptunicella marina]